MPNRDVTLGELGPRRADRFHSVQRAFGAEPGGGTGVIERLFSEGAPGGGSDFTERSQEGTLYDWYHRAGTAPGTRSYRLGQSPELERQLAEMLGWNPKSGEDLYTFLSSVIGTDIREVTGNYGTGLAPLFHRLLGMADRQSPLMGEQPPAMEMPTK